MLNEIKAGVNLKNWDFNIFKILAFDQMRQLKIIYHTEQ